MADSIKKIERHHGLVLELPKTWFSKEKSQPDSPVGQESHWREFASLFGRVLRTEVVRAQRGAASEVNHLLVRFADVDGTCAMYEALTDRYLHNPGSAGQEACHPAICTVGNFA